MDSEERDILTYVKGWPKQFVSMAEIARRAGGKRRFREEPNWALPVLTRLVEQGLLESDSAGHYRYIPPKEERQQQKRWVSPHIQKLLEKSGKTWDLDAEEEDSEKP